MAVLHRMFRQPVGLEPDWTFTQESDRYSEADHRTWISLYDRPAEIVSRRACNAFLNGASTRSICMASAFPISTNYN